VWSCSKKPSKSNNLRSDQTMNNVNHVRKKARQNIRCSQDLLQAIPRERRHSQDFTWQQLAQRQTLLYHQIPLQRPFFLFQQSFNIALHIERVCAVVSLVRGTLVVNQEFRCDKKAGKNNKNEMHAVVGYTHNHAPKFHRISVLSSEFGARGLIKE